MLGQAGPSRERPAAAAGNYGYSSGLSLKFAKIFDEFYDNN
jgi:hypothetical protein